MATSTLFVVLGLALCYVHGQRFRERSGRQSSDVIVDVDVRTDQSSSSRDSTRRLVPDSVLFSDPIVGIDGVRGFDSGFGGRGFIDQVGVGRSDLLGIGTVGSLGVGGVFPVGGVIGGFGGGRSFFGGRRRRGRPACRGIRRRGDCARRAFLGRPRSCLSDVDCPIRRVCCFDGCRRACYRPTTFF